MAVKWENDDSIMIMEYSYNMMRLEWEQGFEWAFLGLKQQQSGNLILFEYLATRAEHC